ncbi:ketopantoate reductase family protein [Aliikangiella coralliicola]|uniref:2-dehydropantoate 2-reductase n=1 Tax=Aliikangiella coralliicola TaxID=2592383 RepID=A0A545TW72_9GAMM|nr:2-dehydropantoate 2-reductase [Aliikangiella coralliicola]TQV81478.1 2-dehydropantoate 2-reductase [Aliikangiella coralliicola]
MKKLSFNIIGAGAIGHLWTSFLINHGHKATLYSRSPRSPQFLQIQSPLGNFEQKINYQTIEDWKDADIILICVKAHQLEKLCQQLSQIMTKPCHIILMMNGMGLLEIVEQYLPQMAVIHASIIHGAYIQENELVHTGNGKTVIGNINSNYSEQEYQTLIQQLNESLPCVSWNNAHRQAMNLKLVINAIINPLTAINGQLNSSVLSDGKLNAQAESLLKELTPILKLILPKMSFHEIKEQVELVAHNTRNNQSSMLQDIRANKTTEIDFINGYLIDCAKKQQIELSQHVEIIKKIKALEN